MDSFGAYLKGLRSNCGLSLSDVHDQCGITDSKLSRAERDEGKPLDSAELKKLAQLYKTSVIQLYMKAGCISEQDLDDYKLVFHGAELLTDKEHQCIQALINLLTNGRAEAEL